MARAGLSRDAADLDPERVLGWRLARHRLDRRVSLGEMVQVVGDICGLHAQITSSAMLSLWARLDGVSAGTLEEALWRRRSLVKTWAMRGTLHVLPARELAVWQAALLAHSAYAHPAWLRYYGIDRTEVIALVDAISTALDGPPLTRAQLAAAVGRLTGSADVESKLGIGWGSMLKPAAFRGLLCFAEGEGPRVRFTRPDRWLDSWRPAEPEAALKEVTLRYLGAYGPARRDDLARWLGHSPAEAGRLLESLEPLTVPVAVAGRPAWVRAEDLEALMDAPPPASVRLLPAFDPWVIGAPLADRDRLERGHRAAIFRPQAWISPVLLVEGRMAGTWSTRRRARRLEVTLRPFAPLASAARAAAEDEAARLAEFHGRAPALTWSV